MRMVIASDTHMQHGALSVRAGDVFIHCGDFSKRGTTEEVRRFGAWLHALPHAREVVADDLPIHSERLQHLGVLCHKVGRPGVH